jgi:MFS family permease
MAQMAASVERAPVAQTERSRFAITIILGHALKHVYLSGLSTVLLPEIKLGLGLSATQVGMLGTAQQFSGWVSTVASGYLGDRFLNKTGLMLGICLAVTGVSYFMLGVAEQYAVLFGAMLFVGIGPSLYHAPAIGWLSRRFPDRRAFVISMHGAGGSLGEVLGPLVAAGLLAFLYWQDVLRLSLLPAIIGAFVLWFTLKTDTAATGNGARSFPAYARSLAGLLRNKPILVYCFVSAFRSVGHSTTTIFLPIYLREDLGYSAGLVGIYLALAQVAGIGSQPVMGLLSDRIGHKAVLVPALALFGLFLLAVPLAEGKVQLAIVILALGLFLFSLQSILISAAVAKAGQEVQSTVVSLIYASAFVGAFAPTIAGVLADSYGLDVTFIFGASVVFLSVVSLLVARFPEERSLPAR